ncbi:hypothetical protein ACGFNU_02950 [Spirillospora sp. NPDC048911]|uniref:hypothetical protein n=1 Tax=Spirillospora sp. NPDC048911 TaxID=3364527 RepID=UPI00371950D6
MSQSSSRPAPSPAVPIIALMVGGALATGLSIVMTIIGVYESAVASAFRHGQAYYLLQALLVGSVTGAGVLFTRARLPVIPIAAAVAAYVALIVGVRLGLWIYLVGVQGHPGFSFFKPAFNAEDLVAPVAAAAITGLRVLMASGAGGSRGGRPAPAPGPWNAPNPGVAPFPAGQPYPGQPAPGGHSVPDGQPVPGGYPVPGQPVPGQPLPGQPVPGQSIPGQPAPGHPVFGHSGPGQVPESGYPYGQQPPAAPGRPQG